MSNPVVIGIYGESNSGKTTLIETLIHRLSKENVTVAIIKKSDKSIDLDRKGKDTWRYRQAGVTCTVLSSTTNATVMIDSTLEIHAIITVINSIGFFDVIIIEGASDPSIPKIKVGTGPNRVHTLLQYQNNIDNVVDMIKDYMNQKGKEKNIKIVVDGKKIPISEFPADIMSNVIMGMLSSLKGVGDFQEATITVTK